MVQRIYDLINVIKGYDLKLIYYNKLPWDTRV